MACPALGFLARRVASAPPFGQNGRTGRDSQHRGDGNLEKRLAVRWKPLLPVTLPGHHPATALLARMGSYLAASNGELSPMLRQQFLERLLGMIEDTLTEGRARAPAPSNLTRFHRRRMELYLQFHLRDPKFSVRNMAADLGLSVSHVNRLFVGKGCTIAEWIRTERLDGCAADLSSAVHNPRSVGEIALSWGFCNLSHFSTAFRKRYGMSPSEWRQPSPLGNPVHATPERDGTYSAALGRN
jgi:AraC-like DNA-binding protein